MAKVLLEYWGPVYAFLRRSGRDRDLAEEQTQAFLAEVLLERELLRRANPTRGKFRSFLLRSLQNYLIDRHRRDHGRAGERAFISLPDDPALFEKVEPQGADDPAQAFMKQWAATVFGKALQQMQTVCEEGGMNAHWVIFEARAIRPLLYGSEPMGLDELVSQTKAASAGEVSNILHSAKRKFYGILREVVAETVDDPDQVEEEIDELVQLLGARP